MDPQLVAALAVTLLATSYLIWSVVRPFVGRGREKSGCGGCGSCPATPTADGSTTFVPVEGLTLRSSRSGG